MLSYWRRRSSNASPVPPNSQPTPKVPPQLPLIPDSTALTATFDEKLTAGEEAPNDYFSNFDGEKTSLSVSTIDAPAPASSSGTPAVAPPSSDDYTRPRSSPEECDTEPSLIAQPSHSQPSLPPATLGPIHANASKSSSPSAASGKDRLTPKAPDGQSKRSTSPGMAPSGHRRFRTSPEVSPGDKLPASQKEYRFEGPTSRRHTDRDVQPVEPVSQRGSGKTRLHLLNPLSLLAKRRSHQVAGLRAEEVNKGSRNIIPIPDDYDPRIRGKIVHDFSAPRPRRQLSAAPVYRQEQVGQPGASTAAQLEHTVEEKSAYSPLSEQLKKHSDHSPVFREHFEDDKRALQVENKAYLQSSLLTDSSNRDRDPHAIPVFARKLPSSITDHDKLPEEQANSSHEVETTNDTATTVVEDADTADIELPQQASGLPKHFKSNASRFSFDMNGVGSSTQEKLLEEKHKEKEAARKAEARLNGEFSDDDDYENDMFDDMDGLEEEIPGVNVDADDGDEFKDFSGPGNIWNKSWLAPNLSPVVASPIPPDVSNFQADQPIGLQQEESRYASTEPLSPDTMLPDNATDLSENLLRVPKEPSNIPLQTIPDEDDLYFDDGEFGELDAEDAGELFDESVFDDPASHLYERRQPTATVQPQPEISGKTESIPLQTIPDEDDLYFDDGEFGELDTKDAGDQFDESIFDDPTSHLYERKQPTAPAQPQQAEMSDIDAGSGVGLKHASSTASDYHQGFAPRRYGSVAGNMQNPVLANSHSGILSEHNLEAFHNALADAANQSAARDRLGHTTSVSERSIAQESAHTADSQPGLISDESRISQAMDMVSFDEVLDDFDYDDNDDFLYDDPIIAAANAEALENDDEGFYGHEFGFYAQAYGGANTELTNGGYFGPRGAEGISRSHSGRGKFREPSLTPITERSEWSTRNSIISVTAHGVAHSNQSVASPGLAQLVDLNTIDDEMSLSALMKLRRDAWGGSNGSLRSSSGSPPPQQYPASNRGSLALSDVSPTVYTVPPDFLGGPLAVDSPIRDSDKGT
ncbi:hypothetical protein BDW74DRAFT_147159 [Aspergillus multicolor]|uniref:uncharacterized protein n=1 Tax=Aspergillus multicolor TaxID=41759 RepID=UPI003CCD19DB